MPVKRELTTSEAVVALRKETGMPWPECWFRIRQLCDKHPDVSSLPWAERAAAALKISQDRFEDLRQIEEDLDKAEEMTVEDPSVSYEDAYRKVVEERTGKKDTPIVIA